MTDNTTEEFERCGYPTASGDPCQHPASEGDSCWLAAHGGSSTDGRPRAIDESDHDAILQAARNGVSERGCARAAGASWQSLDRYLDDNPDFRSSFERARSAGEQQLLTGGLGGEFDSSMAKFLLSTSFGYVKTEKREVDATHEHSGEGGGPIEVVVNRTPYSGDESDE